MKINYLFHSGVSVESGSDLFIFDYYKKGIEPDTLKGYRNVYVFASHAHRDHFDKDILSWTDERADIRYIFSDDIELKNTNYCVDFIKAGENLEVNGIQITTLKSTDEGVAFLVVTPDCTIFHAGDLNWWHWEGEPEEYNKNMATNFKKEIDKLYNVHIDVAFIPVDKRLEGSMYYSIDYLMKNIGVDMVCPIHYCDDIESFKKVKDDLRNREYYKKINFYEGQI